MKRTLIFLGLLLCLQLNSKTIEDSTPHPESYEKYSDVDLSLSATTANLNPDNYSYISIEVTIANGASVEATGVEIQFYEPDGMVAVGGNEWSATQGTVNGSVWELGNIAPLSTQTLTLNFFTLSEDPTSFFAQVIAVNESDVDSSPNNGNPFTANEDDEVGIDFHGGINPACSISANWAYPTCDNNGTPNDPDDDVIFAAIRVLGTNTGAMWTADFNGETLTGNYNVTYQIGPYPYDAQNTVFTISDAQNSNCSTEVSIPAPVGGTCSNGGGGLTCENNPIQNPGFESSIAAWLIDEGTESQIELVADANSGSTALLMEAGGSFGTSSMGNRFLINGTDSNYRISFFAKKESMDLPLFPASAYVRLFYYDINNAIIGNEFIANIHATEYSEYTNIVSLPEGTQSVNVQATLFTGGDFGSGKLFIDDFCFHAIEQTEILSVDCPEDFTIVLPFNVSGLWPISFVEPSATTTCADAIVSIVQTQGPESGTLVPTGGVFPIAFELTDNCGNVETCSFEIDFESAPLPVNLQCPNNITVDLEQGQSEVAVTWDEDDITVSPPCVITFINQIGGAPNGSNFSAGTYLISYEVNGNCFAPGFLENCSFEIQVNEASNSGLIDLELNVNQLTDNPNQWDNYSVTATLTNASTNTATGIIVSFAKPEGVVYVGTDPYNANQGTFSAYGNEEWNIGTLAGGESVTLQVNYFLLADEAPIAFAQVQAANEEDVDSTPGNGNYPQILEDDESRSGGSVILRPDLEIDSRIEQVGNYGQSQQMNVYITLANNGFAQATGVTVESILANSGGTYSLPYAFELDQGTYDPLTDTWDIGSLDIGQEVTIKLPMVLTSGNPLFSFSSQVKTQNELDLDSSPGNGFGDEDDEVNAPGRPCELAVEILNIECIDDPNVDGISQSDGFVFDIAVSGAPDGWDVFFGLYTPDNASGDGDGTFSIGPIPRYMTEVGSAIYDRGSPGCSQPFTNFDVAQGIDCGSVGLPDLRVASIVPVELNPSAGETIEMIIGIENLGQAIAYDAEVDVFFSDASISNLQAIGSLPVQDYLPGQTVYVSQTFDIPCEVEAGIYYPYAVADPDNIIMELQENNNVLQVGASVDVIACGTSPCNDVQINVSAGAISIGSANAAHVKKKIFSPTWETILDCLDEECDEPTVLSGLPNGTYFVSVKLMDANWITICDQEEFVDVSANNGIAAFSQQNRPSRPIQLFSISPNPSINGRVEVMIFSQIEVAQQIQCYSTLGQMEKSFEINLVEGWNKIPLDVASLASGTYILQMPGQNWRQMPVRFVILRD